MTTDYTLRKEERLKSNLAIQNLLKTGKSLSNYPFKIYWNISGDDQQKYPARIAISVPKRKFRHAVDRNLMKRRIREAYRLNKNIIYSPLQQKKSKIILIVLFISGEIVTSAVLMTSMNELLHRLANKLTD